MPTNPFTVNICGWLQQSLSLICYSRCSMSNLHTEILLHPGNVHRLWAWGWFPVNLLLNEEKETEFVLFSDTSPSVSKDIQCHARRSHFNANKSPEQTSLPNWLEQNRLSTWWLQVDTPIFLKGLRGHVWANILTFPYLRVQRREHTDTYQWILSNIP